MKIAKEKNLSNETKNKIDYGLIESDLRNLQQSFKIGKKIAEF